MIQLNSTEEGLELWVNYDEISIMARKSNPVSTIMLPDMVPEFTLIIMNNGVRHHVKETPQQIEDIMKVEPSDFLRQFGIVSADEKEDKPN